MEPRQCKFRVLSDDNKEVELKGTLLTFSTTFEELRDGIGQYTVGIIEDGGGNLFEVPINKIVMTG